MKVKNLITILLIVTLASCSVNEEIPVDTNNLLIGNWMNPIYNSENKTVTYERVISLKDEEYGISYKEGNVYIERTSGWCGTPPLTFYNNEGTFTFENNIIKIENNSYPGNLNWSVVSLTEEKLVVTVELSDQEKEHQVLMDLFTEIQNLSESIICTNETEWNFTAYGSKACGGAQGYIAYSNQIDIDSFLYKVQLYTSLEDTFNKKWNIVSTCDIVNPPAEVICDDGKAILVYNQTL